MRLCKLPRIFTSSLTRRNFKLHYHVVQGQEAARLRFISFHLFVHSSRTQYFWHISSIGRAMHCIERIVCSSTFYAQVVMWFVHALTAKNRKIVAVTFIDHRYHRLEPSLLVQIIRSYNQIQSQLRITIACTCERRRLMMLTQARRYFVFLVAHVLDCLIFKPQFPKCTHRALQR